MLVAPSECDRRAGRGHRRGVKRIQNIRAIRAVRWLTTTDHKTIGTLYLVTAFAFFLIGGVMALLMRAELARPGLQFMSNEQFNQAFTMHGTVMLLMFATPLFAGFANWI
ncbi:cbb3-type cytochrome c oxidase subunit I, partial [Streptomyces sp. NPDC058755]|uniref:cbb3-type cytochrome c oxidase subunit I n=1 Tax=Streptomyces sp. NPDC058755 TaxID=3346624 RepID=UPI00367BDF33